MNEVEIRDLFIRTTEKRDDIETVKNNLQKIIESIEKKEDYFQQEWLLKIYIISTGKFFLKNALAPWDMAEKSIHAADIYMLAHPSDYDVSSMYLLLTNLTFKFEQSYEKVMELYRSNNDKLKRLALEFLQAPDFYQEGIITESEYNIYNAEYQELKQEKK